MALCSACGSGLSLRAGSSGATLLGSLAGAVAVQPCARSRRHGAAVGKAFGAELARWCEVKASRLVARAAGRRLAARLVVSPLKFAGSGAARAGLGSAAQALAPAGFGRFSV